MCKELTRMELAAVKRVAANTKSLRTKVEKLNAKITELITTRDTLLDEISRWEYPIKTKYGYSVEEILDGTYLLPRDCDVVEVSDNDFTSEEVDEMMNLRDVDTDEMNVTRTL